jgi:hypothetical protein
MAFSPYSALKTQIAAWLDWTGRAELTALIPDFVTLSEGHLNGDSRLRVREAEELADLFPLSGIVSLPSGLLALKFVGALDRPHGSMMQISPAAGGERYPTAVTTAFPYEYSIVGNELFTYPESSSTIRIVYYPKLGLVADADTNWLLDKYPGAYLYGALAQAAQYLHDVEHMQKWSGMYEDLLNKIAANESGRYVGMGGTIRGPTP